MDIYTSDSNWQQQIINKQIEIVTKQADDVLDDIILNTFKEYMNSEFYDRFTPKRYIRSKQMRDKIGIKLKTEVTNNTVTFGIEFDETKLSRDGNRYTVDGNDAREDIMKSILLGYFDDTFNSSTDPNADRTVNIVEAMANDKNLLDDIINNLIKAFVSMGFEIM